MCVWWVYVRTVEGFLSVSYVSCVRVCRLHNIPSLGVVRVYSVTKGVCTSYTRCMYTWVRGFCGMYVRSVCSLCTLSRCV